MAETAHFFWHGTPLSLYEIACLTSFHHHGFQVLLWSYTGVKGPPGVVTRDAREILPIESLTKYTQRGVKGSLAAFSDAFRYTLLSKLAGWWFDTDLVCLRHADEFATLAASPLIVGRESENRLNGGVLRVADPQMQQAFLEELERSGDTFAWGWIGPQLITRVLTERGIADKALDPSVFYPLHWKRADLALRPDKFDDVEQACKGSYTFHIWNEMILLSAIPKNVLPPAGSFLHRRFVEHCPELAAGPSLPIATLAALLNASDEFRRLQEFERRVTGHPAFRVARRIAGLFS